MTTQLPEPSTPEWPFLPHRVRMLSRPKLATGHVWIHGSASAGIYVDVCGLCHHSRPLGTMEDEIRELYWAGPTFHCPGKAGLVSRWPKQPESLSLHLGTPTPSRKAKMNLSWGHALGADSVPTPEVDGPSGLTWLSWLTPKPTTGLWVDAP